MERQMVDFSRAGLSIWRIFLRKKYSLVGFYRRLQHTWLAPSEYDPRYSVVSAVFNVGRYLDQYFSTIVIQRQFCAHIQVIVVDDGSTDDSAAILEKWRRRFPRNITVLRQPNGGQSVARNTGLRHAVAPWVTFIDPDDFIERDYFARVERFIRRHDRARNVLNFVSCRHITYNECDRRFLDSHPLRRRFDEDAVVPVANPGNFVQHHVNSVFFRRSQIEASLLRFDARVRPCFEDAHFVARYLMRCTGGTIGFVRGARYYYRKRADKSSTLDTTAEAPERFDDLYRYGYVALLQEAKACFGKVPRWVQRTVLYDVVWPIRRYCDGEEKLACLGGKQLEIYKSRLRQVFDYIDADTIASFELAGIRDLHRIGLLGKYKSVHNKRSYGFINWLDAEREVFELRWYASRRESRATIRVDGVEVVPSETKQQIHTLFREPFYYENRVRIRRSSGTLTAEIDGVAYAIDAFGGKASSSIDLAAMFAKHATVAPPAALSRRAARLRRDSQSAAVRRRYADAWIFIDRDVQADDNAEHLYRYVRLYRPDVKAHFVLRRDSMDWERLSREGFRLIPFGSAEHAYALLNARYLISSHADRYVWDHLPAREYRDLLKYKFIFLQHGVILHDLASWINTIPIDLMLASTERELESLVGPSNRYRLMPSQVALTGMPRHDALLNNGARPDRHILIMPTWRSSLVGARINNSTDRELRKDFETADYAIAWKALLHSTRLKALVDTHGYRVTLFPHPNVVPYLECFDVPDWIDVQSRAAGDSIQAAFKRARLLITDYSSVAHEMAMLGRGVLYYQFDRSQIYTGIHSIRQGYFDYDRDGFGPVCPTLEELMSALEQAVANDGKVGAEYAARAREAFRWRDGNACKRTVQAIEKLGKPVIVRRALRFPAAEPVMQLSPAPG